MAPQCWSQLSASTKWSRLSAAYPNVSWLFSEYIWRTHHQSPGIRIWFALIFLPTPSLDRTYSLIWSRLCFRSSQLWAGFYLDLGGRTFQKLFSCSARPSLWISPNTTSGVSNEPMILWSGYHLMAVGSSYQPASITIPWSLPGSKQTNDYTHLPLVVSIQAVVQVKVFVTASPLVLLCHRVHLQDVWIATTYLLLWRASRNLALRNWATFCELDDSIIVSTVYLHEPMRWSSWGGRFLLYVCPSVWAPI